MGKVREGYGDNGFKGILRWKVREGVWKKGF